MCGPPLPGGPQSVEKRPGIGARPNFICIWSRRVYFYTTCRRKSDCFLQNPWETVRSDEILFINVQSIQRLTRNPDGEWKRPDQAARRVGKIIFFKFIGKPVKFIEYGFPFKTLLYYRQEARQDGGLTAYLTANRSGPRPKRGPRPGFLNRNLPRQTENFSIFRPAS